jgi:AcrR family transcriptional regulator
VSVAEAAWGREDEPDQAVRRILDAAGRVFVERGVAQARMGEVARAAGCSRGTVYRYFADRDALRRAYVDRGAGRVAHRVAARLDAQRSPSTHPRAASLLVEALLLALDEVRADSVLMAWFTPESATTAALATEGAEVLAGVVGGFVDALFEVARREGTLRAGLDRDETSAWIIRVVVSVLAQPAPDERRLLECYLVPALFEA